MGIRRDLSRRPPGADPPTFAPEALAVFERAFRIAPSAIEADHLLLSLGGGLLLREGAMSRLAEQGVDMAGLQRALDGRNLASYLPDRSFWQSAAGKQASDLASGCQDSAVYTILLGLLLKGGPLRQELCDCGLSEGLVIAVLAGF